MVYTASPLSGDGVTFPGGPNVTVDKKPAQYDVAGTGDITSLTTGRQVSINIGDVAPIAQRYPIGSVNLELRKNYGDYAVISGGCTANNITVNDDANPSNGWGVVNCELPQLADGRYAIYAKFTGTSAEDVIANDASLQLIHTFTVANLMSKVNLQFGTSHGDLQFNMTAPGLANTLMVDDAVNDATKITQNEGVAFVLKAGDPAATINIEGTVSAYNCVPSAGVCTGSDTSEANRVGPHPTIPGGAPLGPVNPFKGKVHVEIASSSSSSSSSYVFDVAVDAATGVFTVPLPKITVAGLYTIGFEYFDDPNMTNSEFSLFGRDVATFEVQGIDAGDYRAMLVPGHLNQSVLCEGEGYMNLSATNVEPDMYFTPDYIQTNSNSTCNTMKPAYSSRFQIENVPDGVDLSDMPLHLTLKEYVNADPSNAANTILGDSLDLSDTYPYSSVMTGINGAQLHHETSREGYLVPGNYDDHWSFEFPVYSHLLPGVYWFCGELGDGESVEGKVANCLKITVVENELGPGTDTPCDADGVNYDADECAEDPTGGKLINNNGDALKNYFTSTLSGEMPTQLHYTLSFTSSDNSLPTVIGDGSLSWSVFTGANGTGTQIGATTLFDESNGIDFESALPKIDVAGNYYLHLTLDGGSLLQDEEFDIPFEVKKVKATAKFSECIGSDFTACEGSVISSTNFGSTQPHVLNINDPDYPAVPQVVAAKISSSVYAAYANVACDTIDYLTPNYSCYTPEPELTGTVSFKVYGADGSTLAVDQDGNTLANASQVGAISSFTNWNWTDAVPDYAHMDQSRLYHGERALAFTLPEFNVDGKYFMEICYQGDAGLLESDCQKTEFHILPDAIRPEIDITSSNVTWSSDFANSTMAMSGECSFYDEDVYITELQLEDEDANCLPTGARTDQGFVSGPLPQNGDATVVNFNFRPSEFETSHFFSAQDLRAQDEATMQEVLPTGNVKVFIQNTAPGSEIASARQCDVGYTLAQYGGCYVQVIINTDAQATLTLPKFAEAGDYDITFEYIPGAGSPYAGAVGTLSKNNATEHYSVAKAAVYGLGGEGGVAIKANFPRNADTSQDLTVSVSFLLHKNIAPLFGCLDAEPDPTVSSVAQPERHVACAEVTLDGSELDPNSGSTGTAHHVYHVNVHATSELLGESGGVIPVGVQRFIGTFKIPASDIAGIENIGKWKITAKTLESPALKEEAKLKWFTFTDENICNSVATCDDKDDEDFTFETHMHSAVNYALPTVQGVGGAYLGSIIKTDSNVQRPSVGLDSAPTQDEINKVMNLYGYNVQCWVGISVLVYDVDGNVNRDALHDVLDNPAPYTCDNAIDFDAFDVQEEGYVFMALYYRYPAYCAKGLEILDVADQTACEDEDGEWLDGEQTTSGSQLLLHFHIPLDTAINPGLTLDENTGEPLGARAGVTNTGFVFGDGWLCQPEHVIDHDHCDDTADASHQEVLPKTNVYPTITGLTHTQREASAADVPVIAAGQGYINNFAGEPVTMDADGNIPLDCDDTHEALSGWHTGMALSTADGTCNVAQKTDTNTTGRFQGAVTLTPNIHDGEHLLIAQGQGAIATSGVAVYNLLPQAGPVNPCPSNPSIEVTDSACENGGGGNGGGNGDNGNGGGAGNGGNGAGDGAGNGGDQSSGGGFICQGANASSQSDCIAKGGHWVADTGVVGNLLLSIVYLLLALALLVLAVRISRRHKGMHV
jgi:hypothetical protein